VAITTKRARERRKEEKKGKQTDKRVIVIEHLCKSRLGGERVAVMIIFSCGSSIADSGLPSRSSRKKKRQTLGSEVGGNTIPYVD